MKKLRIGIIGAGFGRRVHLPVVTGLADAEVAALCASAGRNLAPLREAHPRLLVTDRWQTVAEDPAVDACIVAVPPVAQREIVCGLLRAGKHVLCEKPFGQSAADAAAMLADARRSATCQVVDFQFRHNPGLRRMRELIASGSIGRLERVEVLWLSGGRADPAARYSWQHDRAAGGGILNSYASHSFDYVEWLAAEPISELQARTDILIPQRPDEHGRAVPVTAEDSFDCLARLGSGALVSMSISNCHRHGPGHRVEVFGSAGAITFFQPQGDRSFRFEFTVTPTPSQSRSTNLPALPTTWDNHFQGVRAVVESFVQQILASTGGPGDNADFQAGNRAQLLVRAAQQSAAEGRAVDVTQFTD